MNNLQLAQQYSALKNPNRAGEHAGSIAAIGVVMEVLAFGLLLSFGGVVLKRAYLKVRTTNMDEVRNRVLSLMRSSRDGSAAPAGASRIGGANPMHKDRPTQLEMKSFGPSSDARQFSFAGSA